MSSRSLKTLALLALAALSSLALADPPTRVGRLALVQGAVSISGEVGDEANAAVLNYPVTSHNQITTGRDGRTELRIGSTSIRLDADSSLDVSELEDDSLRLHLHYGSAYVRVRSLDTLRGFELSTPQGHVRLQEPTRLRIDAERTRDTSVINVFDGVALVDGGGSTLTVRGGRRAELRNDDVLTGLAVRDSFDDWAAQRDAREDRVTSDRYVTNEMTGYEDLDQYGAWRDDAEYGPLWIPRSVGADWAPYRDGRWTWVAPWGWTWVDNAPWGYAPFHYGRWVIVNNRWCWAPGRNVGRPVWAPALVGWVGGGGWSVSFGSGASHRQAPGQGWYPLTPREAYAPTYRVNQDHLRNINRWARPELEVRRDGHRDGLTVVPHEQFGHRGSVLVTQAPKAVVAPLALRDATPSAPPPPQGVRRDNEPRGENRGNRDVRNERNDNRVGDNRFDRNDNRDRRANDGRPAPVAPPAAPQAVVAPAPVAAPPAAPRRDERRFPDERRDERRGQDERRDPRLLQVAPAAPVVVAPAAPAPAAVVPMPARVVPQAAPEPLAPPHREHGNRPDGERRQRESEAPIARPVAPQAAPPAPVAAPAPAPARVAPPPAPAAAEKAAEKAAEANAKRRNEERGNSRGERDGDKR